MQIFKRFASEIKYRYICNR